MRILCIGDSNTWGYNAKTGLRYQRRWTRVLQELLPNDEIIEEGLNGRTFAFVDPFCKERCGLDALPSILRSQDPIDLVLVMLGTNDLKVIFHAHAEAIAKGARNFIREIQNKYYYNYEVPEILMISPILLGENIVELEGIYGDFDQDGLIQSKYLAQEIKKVCDEYQVHFMDAAKYAMASNYDCIHMDEENHEKLANALFNKIKEIEDKNEKRTNRRD